MTRQHHSLVVATCLCVAALTFVACGGDSKSDRATATPDPTATPETDAPTRPTTTVTAVPVKADPCDLVTKAQAEDATGVAMQDGVSITEATGDGGGCRYSSPPTGPTAQLAVFLGEGAKTYYDTDTRIGHTFTPVAGLGDEAYEEDLAIFVRTGSTWFAINVPIGGDEAALPAKLRELAASAISCCLA